MPNENFFWLLHPVDRSFLITSRFNDPRSYGKHEGLDLAATDGAGRPVAVLAAQRGLVTKVAFKNDGYGHYVVVRHEWPDGHTYVTWYGHMSTIDVQENDFVSTGQKLGMAGTTGNSTGIHLHLTLQHLGHGLSGYVVPDVIDPLPYIRFDPGDEPGVNVAQFMSDETIPDGMVLSAGTSFVKTWRLLNAGTLAWKDGYELAFSDIDQMGAPDSVPLPDASPGQQISVSVPMIAPAGAGRYKGIWKARNPQGEFFEFPVWVDITVVPTGAQDDAIFLANVSIPDGTIMQPGQTFLKQWRVKNTGTTTWRSGYQLAFFDDDQLGAPESVPVPFTRSGEEAVVAVTLKAPPEPGTYRSTWRFRNLEGQDFGEFLHAVIKIEVEPDGDLRDGLIYVSDVTIEDGTPVQPGETMQKIWRVRNTGESTWKTGYELVFIRDEQMGVSASVPLPQVNPGGTADVAVTLKAPPTTGSHRSTWRARNAKGELFGEELFALIEVVRQTDPGDKIDDAKFVRDVTIPDGTIIQAGASFMKTWRIRNTGTTTWDNQYNLALFKDLQLAGKEIAVPVVEPGGEINLSVDLIAPLTPGAHKSTWRLRNPQGEFFGHEYFVLIKVPSSVTVWDNRARFMGHETVDLWTVMQPGQEFEKIWRVRNEGISTWGDGYTLAFMEGNQMGGPSSAPVPLTGTLQTARLRVNLVAPAAPGTYKGYWKLRDPRGKLFGPRLPVWIKVAN